MNAIIKMIIRRKINGMDCTEEESAEIKQYFNTQPVDETFIQLRDLFPIEYGESIEEYLTSKKL